MKQQFTITILVQCLVGAIHGLLTMGLAQCAEPRLEFFEKKIRPVLVKHCYECHSAGAAELQGGLRLDYRNGLLDGGDSGPAIQPGSANNSLLVDALEHESFEMPPDRKLPPHVIADFRQWINAGAFDPRQEPPSANQAAETAWRAQMTERASWWSLQHPRYAVPPTMATGRWSSHPIDRFIAGAQRTKLLWGDLSGQQARTEPPRAAPLVLLRRLCFVLTGLPPSPELVHRFPVAYRQNPNHAFQQLVDQLLASPHYGEHLARQWMDVVRYTDTYGYEWDIPAKGSWEYRDYLTRAFNADIGFDQLIREQVAGDLLPDPRINGDVNESMVGPMFFHFGEHRHGSSLAFNGIHQEMIDNKIDAFSKAFLAMTVACARCHNHKIDPISQRDYYALAGVFMTPRWTARPIDSQAKHAIPIARLKSLRSTIQHKLAAKWRLQSGADAHHPLASGAALRTWAIANQEQLGGGSQVEDPSWPMAELLHRFDAIPGELLAADAVDATTALVPTLNGSLLAQGVEGAAVPERDTYTIRLQTKAGRASALRLEALTHPTLGNAGPGRTPHGNFVLTHVQLLCQKPGEAAPTKIHLTGARADYSQPNYPVQDALAPNGGWGIGLGGNVNREALFSWDSPITFPDGTQWTIKLSFDLGSQHVLGHFRLSLGSQVAIDGAPTDDPADARTFASLAARWRAMHAIRRQENQPFAALTDFSEPGLPDGWQLDGAGMTHGHVVAATPRIMLKGDQVLAEFLEPGYHTHALSPKLPGALRSPETLPSEKVTLRISGGEWASRRDVPQNAFLNEGPQFFDGKAPAAWMTVAAPAMRHGVTRVLTEIATASLNSNFPPRTGVAVAGGDKLPNDDEGIDKRSWFSLTGMVSHDAGGAPSEALNEYVELFDQVPATSPACWQQLRDWLAAPIDRWAAGQSRPEDVKLLNWMLQYGLLDNRCGDGELKELVQDYRNVESEINFARTVNSMDERGVKPINYRLNRRGDVYDEGPAIPRGFLEVFRSEHAVSPSSGSGRLALANYLSSSENPQTARVFVNRLWQIVFGQGIVRTPSDFGQLGDLPSHPELLDWIAIDFVEHGWSTKRLMRQLVLTETFRQSGSRLPAAVQVDPDNRLLHHYPTRRLSAESIRDSLLMVSGELNSRLYGRAINPPRTHEDPMKRLFAGPLTSQGRRSVYLEMSIMAPPKFLECFNLPSVKLPTGRRDQTNVPAQALMLLNGRLSNDLATRWGNRLMDDKQPDVESRIRGMFVAAFGRPPEPSEVSRWRSAVQEFSTRHPADLMQDQSAWTSLAHTIFNAKEFIYYR